MEDGGPGAGAAARLGRFPLPAALLWLGSSAVVQRSLSDFYVEYMLVAPIGEPNCRNVIRSELHVHIQDVFNENGVQIMSPHFEEQPGGKLCSPPAEWNRHSRAGWISGRGPDRRGRRLCRRRRDDRRRPDR